MRGRVYVQAAVISCENTSGLETESWSSSLRSSGLEWGRVGVYDVHVCRSGWCGLVLRWVSVNLREGGVFQIRMVMKRIGFEAQDWDFEWEGCERIEECADVWTWYDSAIALGDSLCFHAQLTCLECKDWPADFAYPLHPSTESYGFAWVPRHPCSY